MRNRILLGIIAVLVLILLGAGAFYFLRGASPNAEPQEQTPARETEEAVEPIISQALISPILSFSGENIWFMTQDGQMFRYEWESGIREEYVLPERLESPLAVVWQKSGSNFIIEQNLGGHVRYKYFNADSRSFVEYPDQLTKPVFLYDDSQIIYDWAAGAGLHELKISDANGENFRKIADLRRPDYLIAPSPARGEAVLFSSNEPNKLYFTDLSSGEFQEIDQEGSYDDVRFSPDGTKLLARKNGEFIVYDLITLESNPIPGMRAAAWKNDKELAAASGSALSIFDLETKELRELKNFGGRSFAIQELLIHPGRNIVFFTDELSGYLYKVEF